MWAEQAFRAQKEILIPLGQFHAFLWANVMDYAVAYTMAALKGT